MKSGRESVAGIKANRIAALRTHSGYGNTGTLQKRTLLAHVSAIVATK
jgi:hypothetical protein